MTATEKEPLSAPIPADCDVGDYVHIACWHSFSQPGDDGAGEWEVVSGRVVGVGKMVCFEASNPTLQFGGTIEPTYGSPLRFTTPDLVFATHNDAQRHAKTLPRPR